MKETTQCVRERERRDDIENVKMPPYTIQFKKMKKNTHIHTHNNNNP